MKKIYKVEKGKLYSAEVEKDVRKNGGNCYFCGKPVYISAGQLLKHIRGLPTHKPCRK